MTQTEINELNDNVSIKSMDYNLAHCVYIQALNNAIHQILESNNGESFCLFNETERAIVTRLEEKYIRLLTISKVPRLNGDNSNFFRIKVEYIDSERTDYILFDWLTMFEKRMIFDQMIKILNTQTETN